MSDFGSRLKEEREGLGLTQAEFAKACGVGRTAQFNYERGERRPGFDYMDAVAALGADSQYIATGTRRFSDGVSNEAHRELLLTIEMMLGLEEGRIDELAGIAATNSVKLHDREQVGKEPYFQAVLSWLKTATKIDVCIDIDMFVSVMREFELAAHRKQVTVSPEKKCAAVLMLYRAFKKSDKFDNSMIADALSLAASP